MVTRLIAVLVVVGFLWAGKDSPMARQGPLTLDDALGVWHCVRCLPPDPVDTTQVENDSTAFATVLPDSVINLYCNGSSLVWFNFRSTSPDTMALDARGPLTNGVDATFEWARIPGTSDWTMTISVFGTQVLNEIRRKIPTEPECSPTNAAPTTWGKLKSRYPGN